MHNCENQIVGTVGMFLKAKSLANKPFFKIKWEY